MDVVIAKLTKCIKLLYLMWTFTDTQRPVLSAKALWCQATRYKQAYISNQYVLYLVRLTNTLKLTNH